MLPIDIFYSTWVKEQNFNPRVSPGRPAVWDLLITHPFNMQLAIPQTRQPRYAISQHNSCSSLSIPNPAKNLIALYRELPERFRVGYNNAQNKSR